MISMSDPYFVLFMYVFINYDYRVMNVLLNRELTRLH